MARTKSVGESPPADEQGFHEEKSRKRKKSKRNNSLVKESMPNLCSIASTTVSLVVLLKISLSALFCFKDRARHIEKLKNYISSLKSELRQNKWNLVRFSGGILIVFLFLLALCFKLFPGDFENKNTVLVTQEVVVEAEEEIVAGEVVRTKVTKNKEKEFACAEFDCIEKCVNKITSKCKASIPCVKARLKTCKKKCKKQRCEKRCALEPNLGYVEREMKVEKCKEGCSGSDKCKEKCEHDNRTCKQRCTERHKKFLCDRELNIPSISKGDVNSVIEEENEDDDVGDGIDSSGADEIDKTDTEI